MTELIKYITILMASIVGLILLFAVDFMNEVDIGTKLLLTLIFATAIWVSICDIVSHVKNERR